MGGEKYSLKDKNNNEISNGVVPTKRAIEKENDDYLTYICFIILVFSGYLYYCFKDMGYKKKLIFKNDKKTYVILKGINKSNLLLQEVTEDKDGLYIFKNNFSVIEKIDINNKELEYESSEDVNRRRGITTYNDWKNLKRGNIIFLTVLVIVILIFLGVYFWLSDVGFIWGMGLGITITIFMICFAIYQKSLYKKGEVIVTEEQKGVINDI